MTEVHESWRLKREVPQRPLRRALVQPKRIPKRVSCGISRVRRLSDGRRRDAETREVGAAGARRGHRDFQV